MTMNFSFLIVMAAAAVWAVMSRSLLKSAIGLAFVSIIVTIFMFSLGSPIAAVFELSVCTGLITVIFLSTIGLTKPMTDREIAKQAKERRRRYWPLPLLVILAAVLGIGLFFRMPIDLKPVEAAAGQDVRDILWNMRGLELLGQVIILLAGGLGVVTLFKEITADEW